MTVRGRSIKAGFLLGATAALTACGVESLEDVSLAEGRTEAVCATTDGDDFSLRVVYDVTNTYAADALRKQGAPAGTRGIERTELLMRGDMTLIRRTGRTWRKDPEQYNAWHAKGDFLNDPEISPKEIFERGTAWKEAGAQIPMVSVPIEWVDMRAPAPRYSYRYGLDPMAPLLGERWRDTRPRLDPEQLTAALLEGQFPALDSRIGQGITVSDSTFAGQGCQMLRKRSGQRVHETCYATIAGKTVVLHGMDSSPDGVSSQTAVSVETGVCLTDEVFTAPGRVRFQETSG